MKPMIIFLSFFTLLSCNSFSQDKIDLSGKVLIGETKEDKLSLLANKKDLLDAINKALYPKDNLIDDLSLNMNYTEGDKKIKYYFINFSSSKKHVNITKWLFNYNGKLFIDKSNNPEILTHEDLFTGCEGIDSCIPRLFYIDEKYIWSCREKPMCVVEETEENKCIQTNSAL